jgi:hypothetical protein
MGEQRCKSFDQTLSCSVQLIPAQCQDGQCLNARQLLGIDEMSRAHTQILCVVAR